RHREERARLRGMLRGQSACPLQPLQAVATAVDVNEDGGEAVHEVAPVSAATLGGWPGLALDRDQASASCGGLDPDQTRRHARRETRAAPMNSSASIPLAP